MQGLNPMGNLEQSVDSEHARERLVHPNKLLRFEVQTVSAGSGDEHYEMGLALSRVFITKLLPIRTLAGPASSS